MQDYNKIRYYNTLGSNIPAQSSNSSMHESLDSQVDLYHTNNSSAPTNRKRKMSFQDNSDLDDDNLDDVKSVKTNEESKKHNHSEIEKRRRDKMNTYITELSAIIPMCHAMSRKLDKLTVLRMAVQHLKTIKGAVNSYTEGHYKPSFLSDQELQHLVIQATDGFLFVVSCDRGRILYVSKNVSKILNYTQGELLGQSLFDILHPKDIGKAKEQLSSSDLNPRERLIDVKTMLPVKTSEVPQGSSRLSPGARRSFFCRMRCKLSSQVKEEADTTTGCHKRKKQQYCDKRYSIIHCTGYLKSWTPEKSELEDQETDGDGDSCNLSCLVAVGKVVPNISVLAASQFRKDDAYPIQFISRHTLDGKFLFVDQRATLVLGFLQHELIGSSMYEYYHQEDIAYVAESHKKALQNTNNVTTKIYRFRTKTGDYVKLQTEWKLFKNPWTKDIEYLIAKNKLILTESRMVESSEKQTEDLEDKIQHYPQSSGKHIQRVISSHVEASKIGRQVAAEVLDLQRRKNEISVVDSPNSEVSIPSENNLENITSNVNHVESSRDACQSTSTFTQEDHLTITSTENNNKDGVTGDQIIEIMEGAIRESPSNEPVTGGNDEAAMAVIMSLLEADAGLGGPVDFSGLPWPLP